MEMEIHAPRKPIRQIMVIAVGLFYNCGLAWEMMTTLDIIMMEAQFLTEVMIDKIQGIKYINGSPTN